jgi:hypothetical protein
MKHHRKVIFLITFILFNVCLTLSIAKAQEEYTYVSEWTHSLFSYPYGIGVDSSDNVYVPGTNSHCILKFTSDGDFLSLWGSEGRGSGDGQFDIPISVAFDSFDNVYVYDWGNARIQKFTSDGTFITKWGSYGTGDGQFGWGWGSIAVDSFDNVYVVDGNNNRIQKFTSDGTFITKWGSYGAGDGQFDWPTGITIDSYDNVYVVDYGNNRIQKFTSNGAYDLKWGSEGAGDGQFYWPWGSMAVDSFDHVFIADPENHRFQKFTSDGTFITKWGSYGTGDGQFIFPTDIAIDSLGYAYVVDGDNNRIQKFAPPALPDTESPVVSGLQLDPLPPIQVGIAVSLTASTNDLDTGGSNIASAEYSLDGGTTWHAMDADPTTQDVDGFDSPTEDVSADLGSFNTSAVYAVAVRCDDTAGNVSEIKYIMLVVYDPEGGFVTGGGWIDSPVGAYSPDPTLTGKANFGFVSKYKKGATVPTGNTEFRFKAGNLNFHSEGYEWLVVTGSNYARFKGQGTINGEGDYKFMLWAGDGELDTFRIKIWTEDVEGVETVEYDNGFDQPISGGSIKIHE